MNFAMSEHEYEMHRAYILAQVSSAVACLATFNSLESIDKNYSRGRKLGAETVPPVRRNMNEYLQQMDDHGFRRRYRMEKVAFWTLLDIIESRLRSTGIKKKKRGGVPNGPISKAARLSMALRVFAGGNPLDIAEVHGVGDDESMIRRAF